MQHTEYDRVYEEALKAGGERDYPRAVRLLTWLVASTDQYPQALLYLGRSYHALEQHGNAVRIFEFYLKLVPDSGPGHFFLGRTYLAIGQYRKSAAHLRYVTEHNPNFLPAQSLLGLTFLKLRKPDIAIKYFRYALDIDPDNQKVFTGYLNALMIKSIRLCNKGEVEEAEKILCFILKNRTDAILPHIYIARIYRDMGMTDRAIKHYEHASRLSPHDPVFPLLKSIAMLQSGDTASALKEIDRLRDMQKDIPATDNPEILIKFLTISLFQQKRYREALRYGKQLLKANYRDADIHAIYAESYLNLGEFQKARNHFQRCIDIRGDQREYHHGLSLALWELKDYNALLRETNRIQRIYPEDDMAQYFKSLCLAEREENAEANIPSIRNLIRKLGPDVHLMYALGREYLRNGMTELSEGWFLRTIKLDNRHQNAYQSLIDVYRIMAREDKARSLYSQYLALYPDDAKTKRGFIRLLIKIEAYEEAAHEITSLLSHKPGNKALKKNLARCTLKAEKFHEAAVLYKELLKDEPDSILYLRSLTYSLEKIGNLTEATNLLELAAQYFKNKTDVLLPLGVLYFKGERYEESSRVFRSIIEKTPKEWRAYQNLAVVYKATGQDDFADKFLDIAQKYRKEREEAVK